MLDPAPYGRYKSAALATRVVRVAAYVLVASAASLQIYQLVLNCVPHHFRGGVQVQFLFEILTMDLGGLWTDAEALRNFFARRPLANQPQHLSFAMSQRIPFIT